MTSSWLFSPQRQDSYGTWWKIYYGGDHIAICVYQGSTLYNLHTVIYQLYLNCNKNYNWKTFLHFNFYHVILGLEVSSRWDQGSLVGGRHWLITENTASLSCSLHPLQQPGRRWRVLFGKPSWYCRDPLLSSLVDANQLNNLHKFSSSPWALLSVLKNGRARWYNHERSFALTIHDLYV